MFKVLFHSHHNFKHSSGTCVFQPGRISISDQVDNSPILLLPNTFKLLFSSANQKGAQNYVTSITFLTSVSPMRQRRTEHDTRKESK